MKNRLHRTNKILATAIATMLAVGAAPSAWAQSAEATLRGHATAGTEVTARNVATGAVRHTTTSADGNYVLVGLPAGVYRVDAGAGTERVVTVNVATTSVLDFAGNAAALAPETTLADITVKSSRLVEVRTSEVGTIVSLDQIQTVPQLTRNFLEFADVVPGIVFNVNEKGKTSIRGGAQNENSVNVYIDGVGQKGYVRSGVSGQTDSTQGNPFPQLAIGEYKVITSNYKAEYDQISSAAVTAETKSGTNEFHGEAFATYTNQSMRAETPGELAAGQKTDSKTKEFGASVGGPIMQDTMHFFLAYEGKRYNTPTTVTANGGVPADVVAALPAAALAQLGPLSIPFQENLYFGKLDWEPTADDRIVFDMKIRKETSLGDGVGSGKTASAALQTSNNDDRYALRWEHASQNYFNELLFTFEDAFFQPQGANGGVNGAVYTYKNSNNDSTILETDGVDPRSTQNKGQKGWAIADNITWSHLNWITGDHTVKAGVKFKSVKLTAKDAESGYNPIFFYDVTPAGTAAIPYKAVFAAVVSGLPPVAETKDRQFGIYLQDDWAVDNKLTLNLGVRYDIEMNPSYLDFVTPQVVRDSMDTIINTDTGLTYGQSLGLSSDPNTKININDYLSNGHNRKAFKGEFQPRIGFSYDLFEDQRHVVFGGIGRAYDRDLYDYLQLEITKIAISEPSVLFETADHSCAGQGNCFAWNPNYLNGPAGVQALVAGQPGEINLMNNKLKTPYSDQFSLGIRNKVGDWNTSAAISRILSKDGLQFILGNRRPNGDFFGPEPWGGIGQPWTFGPPGIAGNLILANNAIETRSTSFLLSADKPYSEESGWGATLAYTFTDATQNRDINEHYVFDGVSAKAYPFIRSNAAAKHRFVGTATVKGPWDTVIGAKLTIATPIPKNDIQCYWTADLFPSGGPCLPAAVVAHGLGIRTLDMQLTKNFRVYQNVKAYLRVDALNVFNAKNLVDYDIQHASNGLFSGGSYSPNGNINGTTRQFRLTFGAKF